MENAAVRMTVLAPRTMRRMMITSAQSQGGRNYHQFTYPHSHSGANNAYGKMPRNQKEISRQLSEGDQAPLAHQDTRQFPDWYKPYTFNYHGDGYMALFFGGFLIAGWSYTNDICEQKGRKSRKIFESDLPTNAQKVR